MATPTTSVRPEDVIRRVGDTNERALAYVLDPDPQLQRLSRKVREALITDLPPVTAGALLGPAALARHFVASAASGRYRDLFPLWQLFVARPDECRPVLAERQRALEKARGALGTAVRLGIRGHAERVAQDVQLAEGLIWQWLRESLAGELPAIGHRPALASAVLTRDPTIAVPLPSVPDDRWLAEAADARRSAPLAPAVEALLAQNAHRLPATIATLSMAWEHYPDRVGELVSRIDLDSPSIGALLAWSRDHGLGDRVATRISQAIEEAAAGSRADGVAAWYAWRERGVDVDLPASLRSPDLDGLDLSRPDVAALAATLIADGAPLDMQALIVGLARENKQRAEKAYEAYVCAGLDVTLPPELESNPLVKEGTRCPWCQSWTYVRAGHERRCPRRPAQSPNGATPHADDLTPPEPEPTPPPDDALRAWDDAALDATSAAPLPDLTEATQTAVTESLPDLAEAPQPTATTAPLPDLTEAPQPTADEQLPDLTEAPQTAVTEPLPDIAEAPQPTATTAPLPDLTEATQSAVSEPLPDLTEAPQPTAATAPLPDLAEAPQLTADEPLPDLTEAPQPTAATAPLPDLAEAPQPTGTTELLPDFTEPRQPTATTELLPDLTEAPQPTGAMEPLPDLAPATEPTAATEPQPPATEPLPYGTEVPGPVLLGADPEAGPVPEIADPGASIAVDQPTLADVVRNAGTVPPVDDADERA